MMFIAKTNVRFMLFLCALFSASLFTPFSLQSANCNLKIESSPVSTNNSLSVYAGDYVSITSTLVCSSPTGLMTSDVSPIPTGMIFQKDNELQTMNVYGNPLISGSYNIYFYETYFNVSSMGMYSASETFKLIVKSPPPPEAVQVTQQPESISREKIKNNNAGAVKNILRWNAPKKRSSIVAYRIYLDRDLQLMVGEIPSLNRKRIRVVHRHVDPCQIHKYFIVSVDEFGNISRKVKVRVKESRCNCLLTND